MTKHLTVLFTLVLLSRLPAFAQTPSFTATPASFITVSGAAHSGKFLLEWEVKDNETAYQFEVEKSTDGKNFTMAALVFGTDKAATDTYQFYEKAARQKTIYRIRIVNKNRTTEYSRLIEINPLSLP